MNLDVDNPIPLHIQLRAILRKRINQGFYEGPKIPSERELIEEFKVSRTTVREAVSELVHEGLLEKKHGKGTYITFKSSQEWISSFKSYSETIESLKTQSKSQIIYKKKATKPEYLQELLKSDQFYVIECLRFVNKIPIIIEKKYYPLQIGMQLAKFDLSKENAYKLLESSLGIILAEANQSISSELPTERDANYLKIPKNMRVLVTERKTYDSDRKIVEFCRTVYRSDKYFFKINLKKKTNQKS